MQLEFKNEVVGKWPGILTGLGIDVGDGKHRPCPACGGTDRFRLDEKEGRGTWICNQCGAGDGWALVKNVLGIGFGEAVSKVKPLVGMVERNVPKRPAKNTNARKRLNALWSRSNPLTGKDMASQYFSFRGLTEHPDNVRLCPSCYEPDSKKRFPAMLAMVQGPDGKPVTIHRTYLVGGRKADIPSPKKLMPAVSELQGAAIRLFKAGKVLGIAEGIETAIACKQRFGVPTWAAVTSSILVSFKPPRSVERIIIYGDNDLNFTGQKVAYTLGNRLVREGRQVEVLISPQPGRDWADIPLEKVRVSA